MTDDDDDDLLSAIAANVAPGEAGRWFSAGELKAATTCRDREDQREIDAVLSRIGGDETKNMLRIAELEALRDSDFGEYCRIGGSDEYLRLVTGEEVMSR